MWIGHRKEIRLKADVSSVSPSSERIAPTKETYPSIHFNESSIISRKVSYIQ